MVTDPGSSAMNSVRMSSSFVVAAFLFVSTSAQALPFQPTLDEFWIIKNGSESFRDSFSDGKVPPSGPQDGINSNPDTYNVHGPNGMTSESGGRLKMTPSLGEEPAIASSNADVSTGAIKLRSTNDNNANSLMQSDAFAVHGLYDLSVLPQVNGQSFSIRITDRAVNQGNEGDDAITLSLVVRAATGELTVSLNERDYAADIIDTVDRFSVEALLKGGTAEQIEFIISKGANSDDIAAQFVIYGAGGFQGGDILLSHSMSTFSTLKDEFLKIYEGETYTRAAFASGDVFQAPEPGTLAVFVFGLAGLGIMRRKRAV